MRYNGDGGRGVLSRGAGMKAWWTSVENGNICVRTKGSVEQQSALLSEHPPPPLQQRHPPTNRGLGSDWELLLSLKPQHHQNDWMDERLMRMRRQILKRLNGERLWWADEIFWGSRIAQEEERDVGEDDFKVSMRELPTGGGRDYKFLNCCERWDGIEGWGLDSVLCQNIFFYSCFAKKKNEVEKEETK